MMTTWRVRTFAKHLKETDKQLIWKPRLAFLNALGPAVVEKNLDDEEKNASPRQT